MLILLDLFYTMVHLAIIGFNLLGWIWTRTRRAHLISVLITAGSWLILGIWYGIGYCPVTEWQWNVKRKLGEDNLPGSFIKYFADKVFNTNFDPNLINTITAVSFGVVAFVSIMLNVKKRKLKAVNNEQNPGF